MFSRSHLGKLSDFLSLQQPLRSRPKSTLLFPAGRADDKSAKSGWFGTTPEDVDKLSMTSIARVRRDETNCKLRREELLGLFPRLPPSSPRFPRLPSSQFSSQATIAAEHLRGQCEEKSSRKEEEFRQLLKGRGRGEAGGASEEGWLFVSESKGGWSEGEEKREG